MDLTTKLLNKPINQENFGSTGERKMVLRQDQSPGDILTFTCALAALKEAYPHFEIDVDTPCPEIFENNPRITPLDKNAKDVEVYSVRYDSINESGWRGHHFADAFRMSLETLLGIEIPSRGIRPELFIGEDERHWWHWPHCSCGWDKPFWCINAGRKADNELKQYHRWPEVAELFNERFKGEVGLVQIGHPSHIHPPLPGVMNAVGETNDLRQLIRLIYNAHGTIGPISFQMVASEAFEQPYVAVGGGKESLRWQATQQGTFLHTVGKLKCCEGDGCWKGGNIGGCVDLVDGAPRCFTMITPEAIVDAVEAYYIGGRLQR